MSVIQETDALILCGGLGKRLRPQIGEAQKTMADISGRPFLELQTAYLKDQGVRRVILCTGYQADEVERYFAGNKAGMKIEFSREKVPLGTGGAVKNAAGLITSDPFVVLNGDSLCRLPYQRLLSFHAEHKADVSIAVAKVKDGRDYGTIRVDETGRITAFTEKAKKSEKSDGIFVNAGVYCFNKNVLNTMPAGTFSLEEDLFPTLAGKACYGFSVENGFLDIGTPERLLNAKNKLKKAQ